MSREVTIPESDEDLSLDDRIYLYDRGRLPQGWRAPTQEERGVGNESLAPASKVVFDDETNRRVTLTDESSTAEKDRDPTPEETYEQQPNSLVAALEAKAIKDTVGDIKEWCDSVDGDDFDERVESALAYEGAKEEDAQRSTLMLWLTGEGEE